jgi:glutamyl-tRNA synthetase
MKTSVRVRFAPSPTGFLHLGGMRSAIFNWLYVQKMGGQFVLRIEDTDQERFVPEAAADIEASLNWLGASPDESPKQGGKYGPYQQSERLELYKSQANVLTKSGQLYPCWCSPERLDQLRQAARTAKQPFKYDRHCIEHPGNLKQPHVLRFRIPEEPKHISWHDVVRGPMTFDIADQDDFVAIKSDGFPTYNFANVVDDHQMAVTDVLRAEEFLSSTPKHLLLYAALGWDPPRFGHLPQVLGPDGSKKLSKRHGAKPTLEYRDEGYLPEAIVNFLALLGWNEGHGSTKELYSRHELIQAFSLERIQKSPAVFDIARLDWMNGEYLRAMPVDELTKRLEPFMGDYRVAWQNNHAYALAVTKLIQDRLKRLSEAPALVSFFFDEPKLSLTTFDAARLPRDTAAQYIGITLTALEQSDDFTEAGLEALLRQRVARELNLDKTGPLFMAIRIAITGSTATPPLFETMAVLGRQKVIQRLKSAQQQLSNQPLWQA